MKKLALALLAIICALSFAPALAQAQSAPGGRTIVYPKENPPSVDTVLQPARFTRLALGTWMLNALNLTGSGSGVYSNCTVTPGTGLFVTVAATLSGSDCAIYQVAQSDANPIPVGYSPQLAADTTLIAVQALMAGTSNPIGPLTPPGSNSVYWLIEARIATVDTNAQTRSFNLTGVVTPSSVNTQRADQFDAFVLKQGTPSATPAKPSVDSGYIAFQYVLVPTGTTQILSNMLSDGSKFSGFAQTNAPPAGAIVLNPSPSPSPQSGNAAISGNFASGTTTIKNFGATTGLCTDVNGNVLGTGCNQPAVINVLNPTYGAKCDNATDDSAAIQAALDAAKTSSTAVKVVLPPGATCLAHGLVMNGSNVKLEGAGSGFSAFPAFVAVGPSSALSYNGTLGGTLLTIAPPTGNNIIARNSVSGIAFLSNSSTAAVGLYVKQATGVFRDLYFDGFTTAAINVHGSPMNNGSHGDSIASDFDSISIDEGVSTGGDGILCDGDLATAGNCDYNTFHNISIRHYNGVGLHFKWSDANWGNQIHIVRAGGGTGYGVVFDCGAHSNRLGWLTASAGYAVRGTTSCPGSSVYNNPATSNTVTYYDVWDNNSPKPTIEAGSIGNNWSDDRGNLFNQINPTGQTQSFVAFGASNASSNVPDNGVPTITTNLAGDRIMLGCYGTGQNCPVSFQTSGSTDGIQSTIGSAGQLVFNSFDASYAGDSAHTSGNFFIPPSATATNIANFAAFGCFYTQSSQWNGSAGLTKNSGLCNGTLGALNVVVNGTTVAQIGASGQYQQQGTNTTSCFICYGALGGASSGVVRFGNAAVPSTGYTSFGSANDGTVTTIQNSVLSIGNTGTKVLAIDNSGNLGILGAFYGSGAGLTSVPACATCLTTAGGQTVGGTTTYSGSSPLSFSSNALIVGTGVVTTGAAAFSYQNTDASCTGTNLLVGWKDQAAAQNAKLACNGAFTGLSASLSGATPLAFTTTTTPTITSAANGSNVALIINANNGATTDLLDVQLAGANKFQVLNGGGLNSFGSQNLLNGWTCVGTTTSTNCNTTAGYLTTFNSSGKGAVCFGASTNCIDFGATTSSVFTATAKFVAPTFQATTGIGVDNQAAPANGLLGGVAGTTAFTLKATTNTTTTTGFVFDSSTACNATSDTFFNIKVNASSQATLTCGGKWSAVSASYSSTSPMTFTGNGSTLTQSGATGSTVSWVLNSSNGSAPTGDLLDVQLGAANKFQVLNTGGVTSQGVGTFAGVNDSGGTTSACVGTDGSKNYVYNTNCLNLAGGSSVSGTTTFATINVTGALSAGSATGATLTAGDLGASRSTTTGQITIGGSSASCNLNYNISTSNQLVGQCNTLFQGTLRARTATNSSTVQGYVSPVFKADGTADVSTQHGVQGTCAFSATTSCAVTFTASTAATMASSTSFACWASQGTGTSQANGFVIGNQSTSGFTIYTTPSTSITGTIPWVCDGT